MGARSGAVLAQSGLSTKFVDVDCGAFEERIQDFDGAESDDFLALFFLEPFFARFFLFLAFFLAFFLADSSIACRKLRGRMSVQSSSMRSRAINN